MQASKSKAWRAAACFSCGLSPVASHPARRVVDMSRPAVDRLYMLEGQCGAWGSIIAAAVHVPLVQGKIVSGELRVSAVQLCNIHKCSLACICPAQGCWASPTCLLSRLHHPEHNHPQPQSWRNCMAATCRRRWTSLPSSTSAWRSAAGAPAAGCCWLQG